MCCGLILSSSAFAAGKQQREIETLSGAPVLQNEIPNVFRPIGNFFKRLFGKRRQPRDIDYMINVTSLALSKTEVVASCSSSNTAQNNSCSASEQLIEVSTEAYNPGIDVLTFNYTVSGGKIIGKGAKVIWDLSGAKPGTYLITAGADDGCGVCGQTITKEVKVIECPNCN